MKTHWLYGFGDKKEIKFKIEIDAETNCDKCVHRLVCDKNNKLERCSNYVFGTSEGDESCRSCLHRYTRWDKDSVPCFHCKNFNVIPKRGKK